jgi:hypothetical protein
MAQLINNTKRIQQLAGLITESQLNEGGYKFNDANEDLAKEIETAIKPAIEGPLKKAMMDVVTKNPKLVGAAEYGLAVGLIAHQIVMDNIKESQLSEVEAAEIKVGGTYIAQMPTSNDGKERVDVKVKVLGPDRGGNEGDFVITPLEDKIYTNPVSKQENEFSKGKQYGIEAKYLKPAGANESIEQTVNEALTKFRKTGK